MYGKIFASLYQGTLRGRSNEILVFTNLIACATQAGTVDKHWRAIAEETGISVEAVKEAIANLEAPDPESRSEEAQGARLVRLDGHRAWGWRIVNYTKYRAIRSEEDRNGYMRDYMAKRRQKGEAVNDRLTNVNTVLTPVKSCKPLLAQAEAEAEAEAEAIPDALEFKLSPDGSTAKNGKPKRFQPPTEDEAKAHAQTLGLPVWEADKFLGYYQSNGWKVGRNPMKDWKAAMRNWAANWTANGKPAAKPQVPMSGADYRRSLMEVDESTMTDQDRANVALAKKLAA